MKNEIWKQVACAPKYFVSNFGRVKREDKLILKNETGRYCRVILSENGFVKKRLVHRLVAEAFIPNHENKPQVNHKDGNGLNNHVDNLEWCTMEENIKHSIENNFQGKNKK